MQKGVNGTGAGTFSRAYDANRRAAIEGVIDVDPVAACVWDIMAERSSGTGTASDLLRVARISQVMSLFQGSAGSGARRGPTQFLLYQSRTLRRSARSCAWSRGG